MINGNKQNRAHMNILKQYKEKTSSKEQTLSNPRVHYVCFLIAIFLNCFLIFIVRSDAQQGDNVGSDDNNALYFFSYRLIYEFILLRSLKYKDPYGFYIAICILIQHVGVGLGLALRRNVLASTALELFTYSTVLINAIELIYILVIAMIKHDDINQFLYRLTGSSPRVNRAYATRMLMTALVVTGLLVQVDYVMMEAIYFKTDIPSLRGVRLFLFLVSIFGLLLVFANMEEEIPEQRIAAIIVQLIKFVLYTVLLVIDLVFARLAERDKM